MLSETRLYHITNAQFKGLKMKIITVTWRQLVETTRFLLKSIWIKCAQEVAVQIGVPEILSNFCLLMTFSIQQNRVRATPVSFWSGPSVVRVSVVGVDNPISSIIFRHCDKCNKFQWRRTKRCSVRNTNGHIHSYNHCLCAWIHADYYSFNHD